MSQPESAPSSPEVGRVLFGYLGTGGKATPCCWTGMRLAQVSPGGRTEQSRRWRWYANCLDTAGGSPGPAPRQAQPPAPRMRRPSVGAGASGQSQSVSCTGYLDALESGSSWPGIGPTRRQEVQRSRRIAVECKQRRLWVNTCQPSAALAGERSPRLAGGRQRMKISRERCWKMLPTGQPAVLRTWSRSNALLSRFGSSVAGRNFRPPRADECLEVYGWHRAIGS